MLICVYYYPVESQWNSTEFYSNSSNSHIPYSPLVLFGPALEIPWDREEFHRISSFGAPGPNLCQSQGAIPGYGTLRLTQIGTWGSKTGNPVEFFTISWNFQSGAKKYKGGVRNVRIRWIRVEFCRIPLGFYRVIINTNQHESAALLTWLQQNWCL